MKFSAHYYDGKSSEAREIAVVLEGEEALLLHELNGVSIARWELSDLRDEHIPPTEDEIFLSSSDAGLERLKIRTESAIRELRFLCPRLNKSRPKGREYHLKLVAGIAAVIFAGWFILFQGIPTLAVVIAGMIPAETQRDIGDVVEDQIATNRVPIGIKGQCENEIAEAALMRLVAEFDKTLLGDGDQSSPVPEIVVFNSKIKNAFALPGGKIVILKGLIDAAEHPNALAGVLAHEYTHSAEGHPMRLYVSNLGVAAVLSLMFGDISGGTIVATMGQTMMGSSYSRDLELDADSGAINLMNEAGYDIRPMADLFKIIGKKEKDGGIWSFLSTHPDMEGRIRNLQEVTPAGTDVAFTPDEWRAIKHMCDRKTDA